MDRETFELSWRGRSQLTEPNQSMTNVEGRLSRVERDVAHLGTEVHGLRADVKENTTAVNNLAAGFRSMKEAQPTLSRMLQGVLWTLGVIGFLAAGGAFLVEAWTSGQRRQIEQNVVELERQQARVGVFEGKLASLSDQVTADHARIIALEAKVDDHDRWIEARRSMADSYFERIRLDGWRPELKLSRADQ